MVKYKGQYLTTALPFPIIARNKFDVQYEHSTQGTVTEWVRFIGQRTWLDTYDWSGAIVEV